MPLNVMTQLRVRRQPQYHDATNSNTTDLMWAHTTHEGYSIGLEFRHALAKVSFSSITNNLDEPLQLTKVTITDKPAGRLYQSGDHTRLRQCHRGQPVAQCGKWSHGKS